MLAPIETGKRMIHYVEDYVAGGSMVRDYCITLLPNGVAVSLTPEKYKKLNSKLSTNSGNYITADVYNIMLYDIKLDYWYGEFKGTIRSVFHCTAIYNNQFLPINIACVCDERWYRPLLEASRNSFMLLCDLSRTSYRLWNDTDRYVAWWVMRIKL